ncbi:MAG: hypothetical protein HEQ40_08065 [Lacibacter sp.]|jgi:hypothetical protein
MQAINGQLKLHQHKGLQLKSLSARILILIVAICCMSSRLPFAAYKASPLSTDRQAICKLNPGLEQLSKTAVPPSQSENVWFYESEPAEEDDEDKKISNEDFSCPFINSRICSEAYYAGYLRTRLSQLNLQKNKQPFISYFVLYHSWKGYLS